MPKYDVFLSYNSKDRASVAQFAYRLRDGYGLSVWYDQWRLTPGRPWMELLEEGLAESETVAVFIGPAGLGKWENEEMRVAVDTAVSDPARRVMAVLLPDSVDPKTLSKFLTRRTYVDFRGKALDDLDTLNLLYCGIEDIEPEKLAKKLPASLPALPLGVIPPANAEKYVPRGRIEEDVRAALRGNGVAAVVGLHAPGGVGKTELANKAARDLKGEFEDVLWVDIGAKDSVTVTADMLRLCGLKPPDSHAERSRALKEYLAGRRLLVVLDDLRTASAAGLADFLPPAPPCAVLVTSRVQQPSHLIPARNTFGLDRMTPEQAGLLLVAVLGEAALAAEQEAFTRLAERCCYNPLALEIAARRIRQVQGLTNPAAAYLGKLEKSQAALKVGEDPRLNLESVLDVSYDDLGEDDKRRFRSLAVFDRSGFAPGAAAYVWSDEDEEALARLLNLSLVTPVPGEQERYRLHDLLDEYAAGKLAKDGGAEEAETRLAEWMIGLFDKYYTADRSSAPQVFYEIENLRKAVVRTVEKKDGALLARLATKPRNWLHNIFRVWEEWQIWLETSLELGIDDEQLKANVLKAIGDVQQFRDDRDAALTSYNEALKLFRAVGAKLGEANVLKAIGDVQQFRDDRDAALTSYNEALKLFRAVGAKLGEANVLQAIGDVQQFRKEMDAALTSYNEALKLFRAVGDRLGEANVLKAIGDVQQFRKEMDAALTSYNEALKLFRAVGDRLGEANVLKAIGDVQQFRKEMDAALTSYNEALKLFRAVGAKLGEANVLKAIGDVQQFRKEMDAALTSYNEALKLFRAVGDRLGEANVLKAIGDVQQFRKEMDAALTSYNEALKLFRAVGAKLGEANVLKAIGDVQQFRDDRDAALTSYNEALKLFRAVGDRLGEANVLKAIGDVQQFRKEMDAALTSYNEALKLFRAVGDRLGEANVLAALTRLSLQSGDIPSAERQLEQVIAMRQVIGDLYDEGADYGNFAIALLNLGHKQKAKEYALKARPIFEKINLPPIVEMMDRVISACEEK